MFTKQLLVFIPCLHLSTLFDEFSKTWMKLLLNFNFVIRKYRQMSYAETSDYKVTSVKLSDCKGNVMNMWPGYTLVAVTTYVLHRHSGYLYNYVDTHYMLWRICTCTLSGDENGFAIVLSDFEEWSAKIVKKKKNIWSKGWKVWESLVKLPSL